MVKKGDKIILVKEMTYFKNVGEVCEVVEVIDDGAVVFTFSFILAAVINKITEREVLEF